MFKHIFAATSAACLLGGCVALAQEEGEPPAETAAAEAAPTGPCAADIYHAFDFWLGDWDVADADGVFQGKNTITREEGGCMILERWTSATGGTGQSYNYVDPATNKWRQVWVSQAANIDYEGEPTDAGGIRLEGTITYRQGITRPFTGEWTPQEDGSVRQYFEQYDPDADSWSPWFLGIYTKSDGDSEG